MRKKICPAVSMAWVMASPRWPMPVTTTPVRIEISSTCSRSPVAKASKKLFGISAMMWPVTESSAAILAYFSTALASSFVDVGVEAGARLDDLADEDADEQRDGGDHLEVDQRLQADATDLLQVADRGDAVHDGAEDDRRDHHLDQRDEGVAQPLDRLAPFGLQRSRAGCRARWRSAPGCRAPCTRAPWPDVGPQPVPFHTSSPGP